MTIESDKADEFSAARRRAEAAKKEAEISARRGKLGLGDKIGHAIRDKWRATREKAALRARDELHKKGLGPTVEPGDGKPIEGNKSTESVFHELTADIHKEFGEDKEAFRKAVYGEFNPYNADERHYDQVINALWSGTIPGVWQAGFKDNLWKWGEKKFEKEVAKRLPWHLRILWNIGNWFRRRFGGSKTEEKKAEDLAKGAEPKAKDATTAKEGKERTPEQQERDNENALFQLVKGHGEELRGLRADLKKLQDELGKEIKDAKTVEDLEKLKKYYEKNEEERKKVETKIEARESERGDALRLLLTSIERKLGQAQGGPQQIGQQNIFHGSPAVGGGYQAPPGYMLVPDPNYRASAAPAPAPAPAAARGPEATPAKLPTAIDSKNAIDKGLKATEKDPNKVHINVALAQLNKDKALWKRVLTHTLIAGVGATATYLAAPVVAPYLAYVGLTQILGGAVASSTAGGAIGSAVRGGVNILRASRLARKEGKTLAGKTEYLAKTTAIGALAGILLGNFYQWMGWTPEVMRDWMSQKTRPVIDWISPWLPRFSVSWGPPAVLAPGSGHSNAILHQIIQAQAHLANAGLPPELLAEQLRLANLQIEALGHMANMQAPATPVIPGVVAPPSGPVPPTPIMPGVLGDPAAPLASPAAPVTPAATPAAIPAAPSAVPIIAPEIPTEALRDTFQFTVDKRGIWAVEDIFKKKGITDPKLLRWITDAFEDYTQDGTGGTRRSSYLREGLLRDITGIENVTQNRIRGGTIMKTELLFGNKEISTDVLRRLDLPSNTLNTAQTEQAKQIVKSLFADADKLISRSR